MLIIMRTRCTREDVDRVLRLGEDLGLHGHVLPGAHPAAVALSGGRGSPDPTPFELLPGVAQVVPVRRPYTLAGREALTEDTVVRVGPVEIGGGGFTLVAGPCAVEGERQIMEVARLVKAHGAHMLRGGAYKPRSSPYSFQGLGLPGLKLLARAREETGLPVVTEALDEASLAAVERYADVVQIGARNMHNSALLRRAGRCGKPVLLKRGMSATLDELLLAAEYLLAEGNAQVILCERGIRTFSSHSRYTLDLSIVPAAQERTHLPMVVDPSHGTGRRDRVASMARAALAAGAAGVMVEVHSAPSDSLSDGPQALLPEQFVALAAELAAMAPLLDRRREVAR